MPSFQGPKVEASLYPSTISVRSSASSPVKLTGKPLMGLSWLSYSWSPDLPEIPETAVTRPVPPVARLETPHASRVVRTLRDLHPNCPCGLWSRTPQTGFAPALYRHGLTHLCRQVRHVPVAPLSGVGDRVERRDCTAALQRHSGLLRRAPVELDEHLSMRSSSTSQHRGSW